jgi:hypothetical protein
MAQDVDPKDIPEVAAFMEAEEQIQGLKKMYPGVFDELKELSEKRNTLLEAADKAVRSRNVSCGPFNQFQTATFYHAEKFLDAVGREEFLKMGGIIDNVPQYSLDKGKFDALVAQNKIPQNVAAAVKEIQPRYKKPAKIVIP